MKFPQSTLSGDLGLFSEAQLALMNPSKHAGQRALVEGPDGVLRQVFSNGVSWGGVPSSQLATLEEPGVASQIGYIGKGTNYPYVNANAAGAVPTVVLPRTSTVFSSSDIVLPARIGDLIEVTFSGRVNTDAASGLILSLWSAGGQNFRDVTSGVTGLQSVAGFLTIAAASTATQKATVLFTVRAEDIDANGMIVLRLFGANSAGAGPATHTFVAAAANGVINMILGKNLRKNKAGQAAVTVAYPGGVKGGNLAFSTTGGAFGTLGPVDPTGATDIVMSATALDVIQIELLGRYTAATNMRWLVFIMKNGVAWKNAHTGSSTISFDGPIADTNSGTQSVSTFTALRVRDVDLVNGTLTLRLYCVAASGTGTQNHTLLGSDNQGGYTVFKAANIGSAWRYAITPTLAWEGAADTGSASLQESGLWHDGSKWNMIYTAAKTLYLGWATSPTLKNAVWTKYPNPILGNGVGGVAGGCNRGSAFFENGVVYIYFRGAPGGAIGCIYGPTPANTTLVANVMNGLPANFTTFENSKVVKGPDGAYWMWWEGLHTPTGKWQQVLSRSTSPLGPFITVASPLTTLQVISNGTANSPDVVSTGTGWRMCHHATPNSTLSVPSIPFLADSVDGQNWVRRGVGADGTANGLVMTHTDAGNSQQMADPSVEVEDGLAYLFASWNINTSPEQGGIVVNDPKSWPIAYGV